MPDISSCPQCRSRYRTAGMSDGKKLRCRKCNTVFSVAEDAANTPTIRQPSNEHIEDTVIPAVIGQRSEVRVAQGQVLLGNDKPVIETLTAASGDEKYVVADEIARGGMGMILRAIDRDVRREVAMKVMLEDADERQRARFVEEAQVTGQLEHPNIVPMHELGLDGDGRLFFTMKLVKGRSLEAVLKSKKSERPGPVEDYSLARLLNIFVSICNAVAFAHSKGVLHRDLKPANVMLGGFGEVLVMDWGLAKILASVDEPSAPRAGEAVLNADERLANMVESFRKESDSSKTLDGTIVGTPVYMPPEQAKGEISKLGVRSDVYSLGAILYEILTLKAPVEGKTIFVLLNNVVQGQITLPEQRTPQRQIPRELSAVAMKALARDPEARYPNVEALRRDVELFLEGHAVSAKEDSAWETAVKLIKRNKGVSITTAAAAVLLLAVVSVSYAINLQARHAAEENARSAEIQKERADRQALEADKQRAIAVAKEREARLEIARGLVKQGDAALSANAISDAKSLYSEAFEKFEEQNASPFDAETGLSQLFVQHPPPVLTFEGHSGKVDGVAFSPDGKWAISASEDRTLKLWNVATARMIRTFTGHSDRISSVAFLPDGKRVLSGSWDKTLKLWDVETGVEIRSFTGHTSAVNSISVSTSGKLAISGGNSGVAGATASDFIRLWDVDSGREIRTLKNGNKPGGADRLAIFSDGKRAVSCFGDITLWNLETGEVVRTFNPGNYCVAVAVSPDGTRLLSGGGLPNEGSKVIKLWEVETGKLIRTISGHKDNISCVAFSPDGKLGLSAGLKELMLWNLENGDRLRTYDWHSHWIQTGVFSPDGRWILSASADKSLMLWDVSTQPRWLFKGHSDRISDVSFSKNGVFVLSSSYDKTLKLWDANTGKELRTFAGHSGTVTGAALSPDGRQVISGSYDKSARLWDIESGRQLQSFTGHQFGVTSVAFSPSADCILTGSIDTTLKLWDVVSGKHLRTFTGHTDQVHRVAFSPDGTHAYSSSSDRSIRAWDVTDARELLVIKGVSRVFGLAVAPDGRHLLSANQNSTLALWDAQTGIELRSFRGHINTAASVTFSMDGSMALSIGLDGVRLWNIESASTIRAFNMSPVQSRGVAFSGDGKRIASSTDKNIILHDFAFPARYLSQEKLLSTARDTLNKNPQDSTALKVFGEWFVLTGAWDWAAESLERARQGGAEISPLVLARCYWQMNDRDTATREFQREFDRVKAQPMPADPKMKQHREEMELYLRLCLKAVSAEK